LSQHLITSDLSKLAGSVVVALILVFEKLSQNGESIRQFLVSLIQCASLFSFKFIADQFAVLRNPCISGLRTGKLYLLESYASHLKHKSPRSAILLGSSFHREEFSASTNLLEVYQKKPK